MQRTSRIYICDLCRTQMDFDDVKFPTELEQHWGGLDYLGEWVDICPKCMVKLLYGEKVKDLCQLLLGRGKKIEEN